MSTEFWFPGSILMAVGVGIYVWIKQGESDNPKIRSRRPSEAMSLFAFAIASFSLYVFAHAIDGPGNGVATNDELIFVLWVAGAALTASAILMLFHLRSLPLFENPVARGVLIPFWISPFIIKVFAEGGLNRTLDNLRAIPLLQRGDESMIAALVLFLYHVSIWSVILSYLGQLWSVAQETRRFRGFDNKSLDRAISLFSFGAAFILALAVSGANFVSLGIFSGLLAAGLSLSMRELVNNIASGMILLWDESVKQGHVIETEDGTAGKITKMTMRYTLVQDRDLLETLIPNSLLVTREIKNYSHGSTTVRLGVDYPIAYDANIESAMALAEEACLTVPRVLKSPRWPPKAFLKSYTDWAAILDVRFWISDPETGIRNVQSDVLEAVASAFRRRKIPTPRPAYAVQVESATEAAAANVGSASGAGLHRGTPTRKTKRSEVA